MLFSLADISSTIPVFIFYSHSHFLFAVFVKFGTFCYLLVSLLVGHLCPSCLHSVSFWLPSFFSPFLLVIASALSFFLSPYVTSHVSKNGLGNASLLSHLFGVYGGVILMFNSVHCRLCKGPLPFFISFFLRSIQKVLDSTECKYGHG